MLAHVPEMVASKEGHTHALNLMKYLVTYWCIQYNTSYMFESIHLVLVFLDMQ